ncbi:hypothetical protein C060_01220 [Brucella melitensis UK22/04]|nr:hypothetical protein C060_01220 [Brucella melitensis UK22/04]
MPWNQVYDPLGSMFWSTLLAALPIVVLLGGIGIFHIKAHIAAILGLITALLIAVIGFGMPADMAGATAVYGAAYGLMPIGWIILNVIFLYRLTEQTGQFNILRDSIAGITPDRRLQLLFIAFSFGAFFEGAAGFGTPVAVTAAMLMGLGFAPLPAASRRWPVADRQHRARRLWRLGYTCYRIVCGDGDRPLAIVRHDRSSASILLGHRSILAHLGLCGP